MAILTNAGRGALVQSIFNQPVYLGLGRGDGQWQTPPADSPDAQSLFDPIGFRKSSEMSFCTPDSAGDIEVSSGTFSKTTTPTRHLYLRFRFDFDDALEQTVREIGVFLGTEPKAGQPTGQMYFDAGLIDAQGTLLLLENYRPLYRDLGVRESFEFVITL